MDNKKKKRNKQKKNQNLTKNTEVLNTEEGKKENDTIDKSSEKAEKKEEDRGKDSAKGVPKDTVEEKAAVSSAKTDIPKSGNSSRENQKEKQKEGNPKESSSKESNSKEGSKKENIKKEETRTETVRDRTVAVASSEQIKGIALNAAKILLPVAACAIIIAVVISYIGSRKSQTVDNLSLNTEEHSDTAAVATLSDQPLAENAHADVNELMQAFCTALAEGDMDTVRTLKDYNTDREIITYEKKSEFIERYDNIKCYTKPGMEENSYFVYVTYEVKFKDIETKAPGLNAFYVYTAEDGSLRIDGDTEENVKAAFKLVTNQDDVVDLYNEINVDYTEATASDRKSVV